MHHSEYPSRWDRRVGIVAVTALSAIVAVVGATTRAGTQDDVAVAEACARLVADGLRLIAENRAERFQGKVDADRARCRGGESAIGLMATPWVDWSNYWAAADGRSKSDRGDAGSHIFDRNKRGIDGALVDLEYQRMELIKFNLLDNKTFEQYLTGKFVDGATIKTWKEMMLPPDHPNLHDLRVQADGTQICKGQLVRHRTLTGICNDIRNPAMGSTGQLFARNVEFESTFPDLERDVYAKNRHGGRLALLQPDPQVISRKLFTRDQRATPNCNEGRGIPNSNDGDCSYKKADFFNVLAAFWIQFMTHDWFSHLDEARNDQSRIMTNLGCMTERVDNAVRPLVCRAGCRARLPQGRRDGGRADRRQHRPQVIQT